MPEKKYICSCQNIDFIHVQRCDGWVNVCFSSCVGRLSRVFWHVYGVRHCHSNKRGGNGMGRDIQYSQYINNILENISVKNLLVSGDLYVFLKSFLSPDFCLLTGLLHFVVVISSFIIT